jgi:hypothetical protein
VPERNRGNIHYFSFQNITSTGDDFN